MSYLKTEYKVGDEKVTLQNDIEGLRTFLSEDKLTIFIVDKEGKVIYSIQAEIGNTKVVAYVE